MSWFRNRTSETHEDEIKTKGCQEELESPDEREGKERLNPSARDRQKEFRESLKVNPTPNGKEKLERRNPSSETGNESAGGEKGNFERSHQGGKTDLER